MIEKLVVKLKESINVSELFVYTASFLTPVLYLIFEKYYGIPRNELGERVTQGLKGIFKGYGLVAFLSLITMLLTAAAFSSLKLNPKGFESTFLHHYLVTYSSWVYWFALYCWYLTLLNEVWNGDFVNANRNSEDATASAFAARISKKNEGAQ